VRYKLHQVFKVEKLLLWRPVDINRNSMHGIILSFVLLLTVLILPIISTASETSVEKISDHPWDHSPITVYIDYKNVPAHYSPTYYEQINKALKYAKNPDLH
jgi:hypothetical protein